MHMVTTRNILNVIIYSVVAPWLWLSMNLFVIPRSKYDSTNFVLIPRPTQGGVTQQVEGCFRF